MDEGKKKKDEGVAHTLGCVLAAAAAAAEASAGVHPRTTQHVHTLRRALPHRQAAHFHHISSLLVTSRRFSSLLITSRHFISLLFASRLVSSLLFLVRLGVVRGVAGVGAHHTERRTEAADVPVPHFHGLPRGGLAATEPQAEAGDA